MSDPGTLDPESLGELARTSPTDLGLVLEDVSIQDQATLALRMPPSDRLNFLVHAPRPMRLVRTLPDADLYMTVREIGPADALPLLALASGDQIEHLVDLESWRHDRFDADRAGAWAAVLLEAGEPTLRRFLRNTDDDILMLLFQRWIRVHQIEYDDQVPVHGPGESEAGDERGFVSPDGYHRFSPTISEHAAAVRRFAELLFVEQPARYQRIVWGALTEIPSEIEDRALHWRSSRQEEHGYPPWDEAITVYAPPNETRNMAQPPDAPADDERRPAMLPIAVLDDREPLAAAAVGLHGTELDRLLRQMVSLANHVLVADALDTGDPDAHRAAARKSSGYVNIALESRTATGTESATETLEGVPLVELFREGYARIVELQQRARSLVQSGWAAADRRALDLLDMPLRPRVQGLLEARPLYYDLEASENRPGLRDFRSLGEIDQTRGALEIAEAVGDVLVLRLGLDVTRLLRDSETRVRDTPRFSSLLLTLMAWNSTSEEPRLEPLPATVVSDFLRTVASRRTAPPDAAGRAMDALTSRLVASAGLNPRTAGLLRAFGRACLERLADECSNLDPGTPVDDRHVSCLVLEHPDQTEERDA